MEPADRQPGAQQVCVICETHTSEKLTKVSDVGLETLRTTCEIVIVMTCWSFYLASQLKCLFMEVAGSLSLVLVS